MFLNIFVKINEYNFFYTFVSRNRTAQDNYIYIE
jgi:hypothetical protein